MNNCSIASNLGLPPALLPSLNLHLLGSFPFFLETLIGHMTGILSRMVKTQKAY